MFACLVRPVCCAGLLRQTNSIPVAACPSFTGRGVSVLRARAVERASNRIHASLLRCSLLSRLTLFIISPSLDSSCLSSLAGPAVAVAVGTRAFFVAISGEYDLSSRSLTLLYGPSVVGSDAGVSSHKPSREAIDAQSLRFP